MTDNEIIKALECCIKDDYDKGCTECPVHCYKGCDFHLAKFALDLINRQKAEIEKLQSDQYAIDKFARDLCKERMLKGKAIADFEDLQDYIRKQKSKAIREFAERLKTKMLDWCFDFEYYSEQQLAEEQVDNLAKEMTEDENV